MVSNKLNLFPIWKSLIYIKLMTFRIYLNSNITSSHRKYKNILSNEIKFSQLNITKFNRDLSSNFKFQTSRLKQNPDGRFYRSKLSSTRGRRDRLVEEGMHARNAEKSQRPER